MENLSEADQAILLSAVNKTVSDKKPIRCIGDHVMRKLPASTASQELFSDVKLRGS
jgi:hypothetical protein